MNLTIVEELLIGTWYGNVLLKMVRAQCHCGKLLIVLKSNAVRMKSCGCLRHQPAHNRTHGETGYLSKRSKEYRAWNAMITRCTNPRQRCWHLYGGRGIQVCERWRSFENFLSDLGRAPSPKYSIDRIDPDGNYEPGNVRWATPREQALNQRRFLSRRPGASLSQSEVT